MSTRKEIEQFAEMVLAFGDGRNQRMPNGTLLIQHIPSIAPKAFVHSIFPPLSVDAVGNLNEILGSRLSNDYRELLMLMNGAILFSGALSLFGIKLRNTTGIEGAVQQPYDIVAANNHKIFWLKFPDCCIIGGYNWDSSRVVASSSKVEIVRCDNTEYRIQNRWTNLAAFLRSEYTRLSEHFDPLGVQIDDSRPTVPEGQAIE